MYGGVLHGGVNVAEPGGLRGDGTALGDNLAGRVHQLPVGVGGVERREACGQVLADAYLVLEYRADERNAY